MNIVFLREVFQDPQIWGTPRETGTMPVKLPGHANGGPFANIAEGARKWKFWQEVPDPHDFGKNMCRAEFLATGGNYMEHIKKVVDLHSGEAVEINNTGEWIFVPGRPPTDRQYWQAQFAEKKKDAALLASFGAMPCGLKVPEEMKVGLKEITLMTHAQFTPQSWEGQGYWARQARVLTLLQVLMLDPQHTTMQEAYVWYCLQKKMCKIGPHPPTPRYGANNQWEFVPPSPDHRAWYHKSRSGP